MGAERFGLSRGESGSTQPRVHRDRFAELARDAKTAATAQGLPQVTGIIGEETDVTRGNVTTTYTEVQTRWGRRIIPVATTENRTTPR